MVWLSLLNLFSLVPLLTSFLRHNDGAFVDRFLQLVRAPQSSLALLLDHPVAPLRKESLLAVCSDLEIVCLYLFYIFVMYVYENKNVNLCCSEKPSATMHKEPHSRPVCHPCCGRCSHSPTVWWVFASRAFLCSPAGHRLNQKQTYM